MNLNIIGIICSNVTLLVIDKINMVLTEINIYGFVLIMLHKNTKFLNISV